jgi:energy-coupling factor transporter ATP-binding protein EcfA2
MYRSVIDSGWFGIENGKTILVGPNEAGKTAILRALQQLNPPKDVAKFEALRDYPRSQYNDITTGKVQASSVTIVEGVFTLDDQDRVDLPADFKAITAYTFARRLDNTAWHNLTGGPVRPSLNSISNDLNRLAAHADSRLAADSGKEAPSASLEKLLSEWKDASLVAGADAERLRKWLQSVLPLTDEANNAEQDRHERLVRASHVAENHSKALQVLEKRLPVFVYFNNYYRVRPLIHLRHLADRIDNKVLDDDQYDYGNVCLLKLLGFSARELSRLGDASAPNPGDQGSLKTFRDQLDNRSYQLNAASVRLTKEIRAAWKPSDQRPEADKLRVVADGQYLKVVVEDEMGVEIELDQRSEGFQWLVSFFVVFFAESGSAHAGAIVLLDEPGLSLHGLKQRDFRETISRLAAANQTIFTTHSPFMVGSDELDLVRVVEMRSRADGTKVHTTVTAGDSAALLPLQEALGYDMAQSLFSAQKNLVLEGLTDLWYLEGTAALFREAKLPNIDEKIALLPSNTASKVVYYATILHANKLRVAALLDSDSAGDNAAKQDTLVHTLGNKRILRTKEAYVGVVTRPEIEDLLTDTLKTIVKVEFGVDLDPVIASMPTASFAVAMDSAVGGGWKYKLAKAYLRWSREHVVADLSDTERTQWSTLMKNITNALK